MERVLIIEREVSARQILMQMLKGKSVQLFSVSDGSSALELLKKYSFDLILSDAQGIDILNRSKRAPLKVPLIFLKKLLDESRKDVHGILEKPFEEARLEQAILTAKQQKNPFSQIIAESSAMKEILRQIEKIAKSHSNIFIFGESGTGKEVIANIIHASSKRASFPFIRVNCAALPDTLIESEFFGHEKGAFTGAYAKRIGRFELSDKGTLLLDEISEIPASLQAKLLRVVQEQEFERVGGVHPIPVDVRLISTSNRDMKEAIKKKQFREDLYYRLNVIPLYLPPLRERKEDIWPLASYFLHLVCHQNQTPLKTISERGKEKLLSYHWPGNIRQLRNVIEYSVIMDDLGQIDEEHLFFEEPCGKEERFLASFVGMSLKELEKKHILATLKACDNNRTDAARKLGIHVRTLRNKLKASGF